MAEGPSRPIPRRLEAADLSDRAFIRAITLLREIRAENPDLPFKSACRQALRQAWVEDHGAEHGQRDAA